MAAAAEYVDNGALLLQSPVRRALVDALVAARSRPDAVAGLTASELADDLELHVTTVRFHLDQLVTARILDTSFVRRGVGRPRKVYAVSKGSLAEGVDHEESYRILAELLATAFSDSAAGRAVTPEAAGAAWAQAHVTPTDAAQATSAGQWLSKVGQMIDVLQDWGYTPTVTTSAGGRTAEIQLAQCPFIAMARTNPAVVCGVHRGLIAGTMAQLGERDTDTSLEPFVGPDLCTAHVTTRAPFAGSTTSNATSQPTPAPTRRPA